MSLNKVTSSFVGSWDDVHSQVAVCRAPELLLVNFVNGGTKTFRISPWRVGQVKEWRSWFGKSLHVCPYMVVYGTYYLDVSGSKGICTIYAAQVSGSVLRLFWLQQSAWHHSDQRIYLQEKIKHINYKEPGSFANPLHQLMVNKTTACCHATCGFQTSSSLTFFLG